MSKSKYYKGVIDTITSMNDHTLSVQHIATLKDMCVRMEELEQTIIEFITPAKKLLAAHPEYPDGAKISPKLTAGHYRKAIKVLE
jgi:hypothetical protein